jgi:hypothetical protein
MFKMASHEPFGHLQHKLWSKEGSGFKLPVWLPTTKSRESTRSRCVQVDCDTPLKSSWGELQFASNLISIGGLSWELWASKVPGVQTGIVSRFHLRSLGTKSHSNVGAAGKRKEYYMGEGGGFLESGPWWVLWIQSCPWLVLAPRVLQKVN